MLNQSHQQCSRRERDHCQHKTALEQQHHQPLRIGYQVPSARRDSWYSRGRTTMDPGSIHARFVAASIWSALVAGMLYTSVTGEAATV